MPDRRDIITIIKARDAGLDPERLALKYAEMNGSAFAFFRGSCAVFYARLADYQPLPAGPLAWDCGDLHIENFSQSKDNAGRSIYAVNDFDECLLAPALWDILRGASSVFAARKKLEIDATDAAELAQAFVTAFAERLASGACPPPAGAQPSPGAVWEALLERTEAAGASRKLKIDGDHALKASPEEDAEARGLAAAYAAQARQPARFKVLDTARRVSGLASLGVKRYSVLAEGGGGAAGMILLDLKAARAPCMLALTDAAQPGWQCEAERVVTIERRAIGADGEFPAMAGKPSAAMVLRDLTPREARLKLKDVAGDDSAFKSALQQLARAAACAQLRLAGFRGAADSAALAAFGADAGWRARVAEQAIAMAKQNKDDWKIFCNAHDAGAFT